MPGGEKIERVAHVAVARADGHLETERPGRDQGDPEPRRAAWACCRGVVSHKVLGTGGHVHGISMRRRGARPHRAARRFLRLRSGPSTGPWGGWQSPLWLELPSMPPALAPARAPAIPPRPGKAPR